MSFTVLGTGSVLPKNVVTNDDLSKFLDTSDEWIRTRTGIATRHIMTDETVTQMAVDAANLALENAGVGANEIDYILCSTLGGDYISPALGSMVQVGIGAACPACDMNAGCSGLLYALDLAAGIFAHRKIGKMLLIAAEGLTRLADWTDRSTCVLFGDGAGAMVLGATEEGGLSYVDLTSAGWADPLYIPFPQTNYGGRENKAVSYLKMDGQEVYKFAVNAISTGIQKALDATGLAPENVHHVLLHQANLRIIEAAKRKLPIPHDRYPTNIDHTGNMSAATIPVLLDECNRAGMFKNGDNLILCAFGAGLTSGTAVLRWGC